MGPAKSVHRRVVKLAVPHYLFTPFYLEREAMDTKSKTLACCVQTLIVGWTLVGVACTMAMIFGTRKGR